MRVGEDESVRQHHQLNGQQSKQTRGNSEGRGAWHAAVHGAAGSDMTLQLNNNKRN